MTIVDVTETKKALRESIRAKRRALSVKMRERLSSQITARLTREPVFQTEEITFLYASMPEEVQLYDLMKFMLSMKRRIAIPYIPQKGVMQITKVTSLDDLAPDKFGILSVKADKRKLILPENIGLVIVPGVAFSVKGERLGMGAGYYDKFLAENNPPAKRVALAFDFQIVDNIPTEPHDEKVDYIITENRSFVCE